MEKEARWKRHFHKSQLFMEHPDPSRFTRGPWHPGPEPAHAAFLAYRITMSLIFLSGLLWSTLDHWESGLWLVFLTNWGFITCTAQSFLATAIVFKAFRKQRSSGDSTIDLTEDKQMPMSYKVYWVLYNISLTVAFFISILYWAVLYKPKEDAGSRNPFFLNFTMHAANSLLCLVELAVGGPPSRFLHVTQPIGFAFVYAIFNVTYWAAGGLGPFDRHFIYPILDWDKNPGLAVGILLASCVLMLLLHSAVCGLSSIRKILSRRFKRKTDNNVVTTNLPNLSAGNFNKGFVA